MFASENHPSLPNIWNEFASGLTSLLVEKILLVKWTEQLHVTLSPGRGLLITFNRKINYGSFD